VAVPPFDDTTILRRKMWVPIGALIVVSLAAWVVALAAVGGKNLVRSVPVDSVRGLYVIAATVVTLVGVPVAMLAVRNIQILLSRGVWTKASVESVSNIGKGGARPVTFSYVVAGRTYQIKRDVPGEYTKQYRKGTFVSLVYDPQHPQRCHPIFAVRG
jgi:hypothetical protein